MKKSELKFKLISELYEKEFITDEQYNNIFSYYKTEKTKNPNSMINNLIGVGVFFVAISIITFFAINWTNFGITVRALLSFAPILITIIFAASTIFENDDKKKETKKIAFSVFAPIAIIASNALIDQTFQLQTSFYDIVVKSMWMFIPIVIYTPKIPSLIVFLLGVFYSIGVVEASSIYLLLVSVFINVYMWFKNKAAKKTYVVSVINAGFILYALAVNEIINALEFMFGAFLFLEVLSYIYKGRTEKLYNFVSILLEIIFVFFCLFGESGNDYDRILTWLVMTLFIGMFVYNKSYKKLNKVSLMVTSFGMFIGNLILSNILIIGIAGSYFFRGYKDSEMPTAMHGLALTTTWGLSKLFMSELSFENKSILFLVVGVLFIIISKILKKKVEVVKDEENK